MTASGVVVDDQIDAGGRFEGPDVPPLAADDPALHVVIGQVDDADRGFRHMIRGAFLDGQGDDVPGFLFALFLGLGLDFPDGGGGVMIGFLLDLVDDNLLGFVPGQGGDPLQLGNLLGLQFVQLGLAPVQLGAAGVQVGRAAVQLFVPGVQGLLPGFQVVGLLVQGFLPLEQMALAALHLVAAVAHFPFVLGLFPIVFRLGLQDFLLGLQHLFLLVILRLLDGVVIQAFGVFLRPPDFLFGITLSIQIPPGRAQGGAHQDQQNPYSRTQWFPSFAPIVSFQFWTDRRSHSKQPCETLIARLKHCFQKDQRSAAGAAANK